ncbi:MAG TPA: hypothetical protein PLO23_00840 [Alphaproteobacteria bacterium]|nr:hypothetical protein [Alphaproteobacteria bacterium]
MKSPVRKSTRDRHIHGYELPTFSADIWSNLENTLGIKIPEGERERMRQAVNTYTESCLLLQNGAERAKQFARKSKDKKTEIMRLKQAFADISKAWADAERNEIVMTMLMEFESKIKVESHCTLLLTQTMMDIQKIKLHLDVHLKGVEENIRPVERPKTKLKTVKSIPEPFAVYVRALAEIFRACGMKVSRRASAYGDAQNNSFLKGLAILNTMLPENIKDHIHSGVALEKKVQRYLKVKSKIEE